MGNPGTAIDRDDMRTLTRDTRHQQSVTRWRASAIACLAALALVGCESAGLGALGNRNPEARAERYAADLRHADAAAEYIALASTATGTERDRFTLLAVDQWLLAGDTPRARTAFRSVREPQAAPLTYLYASNRAALALIDGEPDAALNLLEPLSRAPLPREDRLRIEALRADAWIQKGDPARAVELMRQREALLGSRREILHNRQRLWAGLTVSRPTDLRRASELARDEEMRGWLSLAALATTTGQQGIGWGNGLQRWRERHAGHPAMVLVDDFELPTERLLDYPRRIALLLPLSGRTASAGLAIQNGFLGAYYATTASLDEAQTVRIYDVQREGGAAAAYETAVADGAEFVVGPLLKDSVAELANDILAPVPVLTLNYLDDNALAPPGLFQFALAPEDEAVAAAERALADGHTHMVALAPNTNWGRRVLSSFATAYESLGGTLLDSRVYTEGNPDYSKTIEDLMAISGSVRRYQRMRANLGMALQFDPRRRQDVDAVFVATDAPNGRLLKAQLKFHYSGDLPVYSTSAVHAMDGRSDSDLSGVRFADTPWLVAPQGRIAGLPQRYRELWPQQRRLARLHAMGFDAYHLVAPLFAIERTPFAAIDGATGQLVLDADGRIHRRLAWAEFRDGDIIPLPPAEGRDAWYREEYDDDTADEDVPWYGDGRREL